MKMKQYIGCALYMIAKHLPGFLWKVWRIVEELSGGGNKIDASQMRG